MAKGRTLTSTATLYFNGKQAKNEIEILKKSVIQLKKEIAEMEAKEGTPDFDDKKLKELNKQLETTNRLVAKGEKEIKGYDAVLKSLTDARMSELQLAQRLAKNVINSFDPKNMELGDPTERLQATVRGFDEIQARIKALKAGFTDAMQASENTAGMTVAQLERLKGVLIEEQKLVATDKAAWENYGNTIDKITADIERLKGLDNESIKDRATKIISQVKGGSYKGTSEQMREDIKLVQEYNAKVNEVNSEAFKETNEVLSQMNLELKLASENLLNYDEAQKKLSRMNELEAIQKGDKTKKIEGRTLSDAEKKEWDELAKDIDRVNKSIAAYKESLKKGDTKKLKEVNEELRQSQVYANRAALEIRNLDEFLDKNLHTANLDELQLAAGELETRMRKARKGTEDYVKAAAQLRDVNKRIKSINKDMEDQGSVIEKTAQRLTSYVAVYGAYNLVAGKVRDFFQTNVQLSDAMSDVQKTTGMTADEVAALGKQIDAMDTRTAQQQLYELAATAGQLGIRGEEDIMGFVNASNMITVALNELGSEGTASLMKIATLTGEIASEGTEGALLKIGSAINDLTANSAATAGPIVDFISRVGGVASAVGIATHEMAAMGATFNALNQETEVAGTAMNQMMTALTSAVRNQSMAFAQALNVDLQALTDLVNQGKSMEALVMVFESLQRSGNVSQEALKALGSEGTKNNRIVTALVENIDVLKTNLNISAQAFEDNVSVLNEYNVKNENAAALLERIKNTIQETFTNPAVVEKITGWLQSLKDLVDWLVKSEGAWFALKTVIAQFMAIKLAKNLMNLKMAYKEVAVEVIRLSGELKKFGIGLIAVGKEIWLLIRGTTTLKNVWATFGALLKTHPIMTIFSIVTTVAGAIYAFSKNTKEASEVTEEFARSETQLANKFSKTTIEAEKLVGKIKGLKVEDKERTRLINEFNSKYSKYLGYLLQDKATTDEVTKAYELLNVQLEKDYQLRLLKLQTQNLDQKYVDGQVAYIQRLREELKNMGVDDSVITKTIGYINTMVAKGEDLETILADVKDKYGVALKTTETRAITTLDGEVTSFDVRNDLGNALNDYVEYGKKYKKEREALASQAESMEEESAKTTYSKQKEYLDKEYANLKAMTGTEGEELENRKTAYRNFYSTLNGYLKNATGKQKAELQSFMETFKEETASIKELSPIVDLWGKSSNLENWTTFGDVIKNLKTASPESLASALDKMEAETKGISEAALSTFNQINNTEFDTSSLDKFNQDVIKTAKKIRARLKELNRDASGNFLWGSEGSDDKEKQREARQAYQASVSALKAYFNERETLIRKSNLTEEDMNRQLLATQIEYEQDSQELRKKFIGDENTFDPSKYKGVLSGYEYFTKKDLDEQAKQYQTFGDYMTDGARNMITQSGLKIEELMDKQKENIKKTLLEGDMFAGFEDKFAKMLDELGVLTSEAEDKLFADANAANRMNGIDQVIGLTPEMRKQRIAALVSFADESYKVTADGLKALMMENEAYAEWVEDLDEDQMNAILQKLRWYYDERLSLIKKYQDQINKEFDMSYEQSGQKFKDEQRKQEVDEAGAELEMMEQLGITPNYKDKMQQKTDEYLAEIAKQKARMDDALDRMDVAALEMEEAEQNYGTDSDEYRSAEARYFAAQTIMTQIQIDNNKLRAENEREQTQIVLDEWKKRAEKMGEFSSMFGDYLGEQIMLEKQANDARARGDLETAKKIEQQQKQNKQNLIKNLLNFIVDEAALWAKELGLKMMFNAMSLADDKKKAVEEVSLEGKKSILSIFLSALTGQASEARKGLPGLITGAIVFAATMALQAMAKSAIANMFPEASTGSTNTRKMSTGMLTYEKGNYPVLGNDGKVYDAKYEGAGMKTGVYGGGAHFGIFSEKQPEMIVDGKTTQKIILNYPYIYDAITTIAKNGRLVNAMPTFASGDYPAGMKRNSTEVAAIPVQSEEAIAREERANAIMERNTAVLDRLNQILVSGQISANVDPYANSKATKRAERFMKRRGID